MPAGNGGTPEVGGNIAPGGLIPGIMAARDENYKCTKYLLSHEEAFLVVEEVASCLEEEFLQP